ncbi:PREDICTED: nuclear receptor coactivator 1, partial [Tinamus guttatus]|uniref:nuclear receptor coactivator 1 n=1 Tax=Tinamus guttatus TaxID=94827 RepID=UPI00052EA887
VFGQAGQSQAAPAQQGMYNNMSITVSMAGGSGGVQSMNPMTAQMQMNSLQMPAMNSMCSEQVSDPALRPAGLYCNQLSSSDLLKTEADGAQVSRNAPSAAPGSERAPLGARRDASAARGIAAGSSGPPAPTER